jgi:hypothetical protein
MNMRSTRSTVTFSNPFTLSGYPGDLPAGDYEVLVEEELLQGLSFEAYRRTATYLTVRGRGRHAGRSELRAISDKRPERGAEPGCGHNRDQQSQRCGAFPAGGLEMNTPEWLKPGIYGA